MSEITISIDGTINLSVPFDPEVIAMLRRWKDRMDTQEVPIESTINNLLKDLMIEKLNKPIPPKSKTLDNFGIQKSC